MKTLRVIDVCGKKFGDCELCTIIDSYGYVILFFTECSTNFILMEKLNHRRKAMPVALAVA